MFCFGYNKHFLMLNLKACSASNIKLQSEGGTADLLIIFFFFHLIFLELGCATGLRAAVE